MQVERGEQPRDPVAVVFTGDGRKEFRVLCAVAQVLDGSGLALWFPQDPTPKQKTTGLDALRGLRVFVPRYRIGRFLFLVDREHAQGLDAPRHWLEREFGTVKQVTLVQDRAAVFTGRVGREPFALCCVILGAHKAVEEEVAKLVQAVVGEKPPPDKAIWGFLRQRKWKIEDLVRRAHRNDLEAAFPGLFKALEWIEGQWAAGHQARIPRGRDARSRQGRKPDLSGYRERWAVERAFARPGGFRRPVVRWGLRARIYLAFLLLACTLALLRVISG